MKIIKFILFQLVFFWIISVSPVYADCYLQEETCTWGGTSQCRYFAGCGVGCENYWLSESFDCGAQGDHRFRDWYCYNNENPCSACFTGETKIGTPQRTKEIKKLQSGNEVISQDPQTGENTTSLVEKIYEVSRSAYYKITLKDGKEVKVTGEHPLYAIQQSVKPITFWEYLKSESLTRKAVDYIASKFQ